MAKIQKTDAKKKQGRRRNPKKATAQSLRNAALYYLQRYASSAENLRRVLMRRVERASRVHGTDVEEGAAIVTEIIARYREAGLLDDQAYATAQAQSLHRRGTSLRAIRARLHAKGVERDTIEQALSALDTATRHPDISAAVVVARRRRLGPWRISGRLEYRQQDLAALARRGFSFAIASQVVDAESVEFLEGLAEARGADP
jgi:regulatory protein